MERSQINPGGADTVSRKPRDCDKEKAIDPDYYIKEMNKKIDDVLLKQKKVKEKEIPILEDMKKLTGANKVNIEILDQSIKNTLKEINNIEAIKKHYQDYFKNINDNFKKFDWNQIDLNQNLRNLYSLIDSSFIKPTSEDNLTNHLNLINKLILMIQLTNKMKDKIIEELCIYKLATDNYDVDEIRSQIV
jgi:hypothetical protein